MDSLLAALALAAAALVACSTDFHDVPPTVGGAGGNGGGGKSGAIDAPVSTGDGGICTKPARPKGLGDACGCAAECGSGFCVDGVCCASACDGTCEACNVSGNAGTCSPVPAGEPPRSATECHKDPAATCGFDGMCDGASHCRKYPDETVCGPGKCQGGSVTGVQVCQGGACKPGGTIFCAPYACDADKGACFGTCVSDGQCTAGKKCEAGSCGKKPLGAKCERAGDCDSGSCADGVCCNTACDGACMSCASAGHAGECVPVARGVTDPHKICQDKGVATCDTSGACNGMGGCEKYAAGTVCRPATCAGGSLMPAGTCDGRGTCLPGEPVPCAPFACRGNACLGECDGPADCVSPAQCMDRSCGKRGLGQMCAKNGDCLSAHCVDGVCCNDACDGKCRSCALPTSLGRCVNVPMDQPDPRAAAGERDPARVCLDGGVASCDNNGRCNGAGDCQKYASGTVCKAESCNAATNAYTGQSTCDGVGRCMPGSSRACAPYRCNGARCATACDVDDDCAMGTTCRSNSCGKGPPGSLCTRDDACASGNCEQGVCCATVCAGSCFSCALPGSQGTCTAVPVGGLDPQGTCKDQGAASCGSDGTCNGAGRCRVYASATICAAAACSEGRAQSASTCNGAGSCVSGSPRACAPYVCNSGGTTCFESCSDDSQCAAPNKCVGGRCGKKPNGAVCREAGECLSGFCIDGVCCDGACDGVCASCAIAGSLGKCSPLADGAAEPDGRCKAADVSTCGNDGFCDGKGGCRKWRAGSVCRGAACPAGSSSGTKPATCDGTGAACPAGAAVSCGNFQCDAGTGTCKTSCTPGSQASDCKAGTTCTSIGGVMTCGLKPQGSACNGASECTAGLSCVDGTCCASTSCGACQSCANDAGVCKPVAVNTPDPRCASSGDVCGKTGKCAADGTCQLAASGTGCGAVCSNAGLQDRRCDGAGTCAAFGTPSSCNAYTCKSGACLQRCSGDADCAAGNVCLNGACGPGRKANGSSCGQDDECTSGNCVDGTCCTTASCGTCQTCANGSGVCANVGAGVADADSCATSSDACGTTGKCDGAGHCRVASEGTSCGGGTTCSNDAQTVSTCDGAGSCKAVATSCNGYKCDGASCRMFCMNDNHCAAGYTCKNKTMGKGMCMK